MQTHAMLLFGGILLTGCKVQDASSFVNESTAAATEPKVELTTRAEIDRQYQGAWYATAIARSRYDEPMPIWPPEYAGGATATSVAVHRTGFIGVRLIHPTNESLAILLDNKTAVGLNPVPAAPDMALIEYWTTWRIDQPAAFRMIVEIHK